MAALMRSSSSSSSMKVEDGSFPTHKKVSHTLPSTRFIRCLKNDDFFVRLSPLLSNRHSRRRSILPVFVSSLLSSSSNPQSEETSVEDFDATSSSAKHVQVRFQLQRECVFGERFHLVGDDPKLGSWDPSSSIPMDWSEGHVWTVELDNMPAKKKIQFKFILLKAGGPENISWQPGPDRILLTWETFKTITVCEDWDDAQLQTIFEEELDLVFQNETQIINGDAISAGEEENDLTPMEESVDTTVIFKNLESREDDHILVPHESTPVLVPGLIPFSNDDDDDDDEEEEERAAADTIKEDQIIQPNAMVEVNGSCSSSEMIETDTLVELIQLNGDGEEDLGNHHVMDLKTEIQDEEDHREGNVLENIILGSSNSLKKFLFGFRFRQ